jgi:hypothetical protein
MTCHDLSSKKYPGQYRFDMKTISFPVFLKVTIYCETVEKLKPYKVTKYRHHRMPDVERFLIGADSFDGLNSIVLELIGVFRQSPQIVILWKHSGLVLLNKIMAQE